MPEASRTYWLTTACRIRRKDQSLVIERDGHPDRHIPVTDVRDIVASDNIDVNTAVISLLNQHTIDVHLLSYYGDYAGSLMSAERSTSGETVTAQVRLADNDERRMAIARNWSPPAPSTSAESWTAPCSTDPSGYSKPAQRPRPAETSSWVLTAPSAAQPGS